MGTNSLVSMANSRSQDQDLYKMMKFMMMMKMMQQVGSDNQEHHSFRDNESKYRNNFDHQMMDRMDNGNMMENMMKMMSRMMNKEGSTRGPSMTTWTCTICSPRCTTPTSTTSTTGMTTTTASTGPMTT